MKKLLQKFSENKKFIILILIILGIFSANSFILAAEINWPDSPVGTILDIDGSKTGTPSTVPELIKYIYEWAVTLGGLAVFIALVAAGFQYLTSAGNPAATKEAKDRIKSALLGLILLLGSWLILNFLNPELTTFRPISLNFSSVFPACDTEADCPDPLKYTCENDPNPGDGNKEGICVKKIEMGTSVDDCEEVELYSGPDFVGPLGKVKKDGHLDVSTPESSQPFMSGGAVKAGECKGSLLFYTDLGCPKDKLADARDAYNTDIDLGITIRCVMLKGY